MKGPGMTKVWKDLAADNRSLLESIRVGRARRSYSDDERKMLETEATRYEQLASEYEAEQDAPAHKAGVRRPSETQP